MNKRALIALAALTALLAAACGGPAGSREERIDKVLSKRKDITILVTDSGLGGLSVAADLAARLPESGVFRKARIVFYNALFHNTGYNGLDSEAEKDRIFDAVLRAMNERYRPDILLIACNTLSVVYDRTPFAHSAPFPVIGIVETGVDLIARQFAKTPGATALLFGTKTTIESEAHKKALVALGFPAERIHGQACHNLAGAIERGVATEETVGYIRKFVGEALAQAGDVPGPLFASFNCTHFGYARQQFADAFAEAGHPGTELLDPNPLMADFLFKAPYLNRYPRTDISVEVVSKLEITERERAAIGPLLEAVSPAVAEAFRNYTFDPRLFEVAFTPAAQK
ncbi:MAG: aspartate/glutamate racemase family protein [Candidatus Moduliflexus flocculans]|nr:aspartate/glutamate racemase family protein [Candidatus Moduliflexus flocculans]